jgi:hypothetical protein
MATVRWCREAGATDASSPLPVLFRRSPRPAGTVRPRLTSKLVWKTTNAKPCKPKDSTPTSRGHRGDRPCPMGTLARNAVARRESSGVLTRR